ncbi:replication protein A 70 kDa DNA-binding subunit [Artemisia annua]|uniref:Replication protein A 70 kDa DNA-binding subunit n=1 Tax=Artemisia annua TaxID=35608 RepID=A0A2U1PEJ3_ARTAN|nr:replication protein A 70 kDa DNA-binding subunit [Artemisia annua]
MQLGESFPKEKIDALEKPVIIAVSSCRVSRFRNNLQLSSTPATYYYIDPDIPELQQYKAEYKAALDLNPPLQIVRHPYQDKEQEKKKQNRIPFSKLLTENPATHRDVQFTCEGTITGINTSREWFYPSCTTCTNKALINEDVFECKIHGYNFKAFVTDTTGTVMMTFFSPKADDIVGVKCETFVNSIQNPDPRDFPEEILSLIGEKHIFQFHYNMTSRERIVDFILHVILDKPNAPKQIEDKASGSGTTQEASKTIETSIPEDQETITSIEYTLPPISKPTVMQLPPPPSASTGMQTRSKTNTMSIEDVPQAMEPSQGNLLQQENEAGVEMATTPPTYTYMQTRSRQGKQVDTQVAS